MEYNVKTDYNEKDSIANNIIILIGLVFGSLFLQGILLIVLQVLLKNFMSSLVNALSVGISLLIASAICPYLVMTRIAKGSKADIGLKKPGKYEIVISLCTIAVSIVVAWQITYQWEMVLIIVLHNVFVAFCEEFIARGCIFFQLRRIHSHDWFIFAGSTLIFVFVFHSSAPFLENLIWRLPISIVLALIYHKTKNLALPASLHLAYNVIVSVAIK